MRPNQNKEGNRVFAVMSEELLNKKKQTPYLKTFQMKHAIWLKGAVWHLALYGCIVGIFTLVLYLYGVLEDAILYAAGLSVCFILLVFAICFFRHIGRLQKARQALGALPNEFKEFPTASTDLERMYEEKLKQLSTLIGQMENETRISRQEMMDYYGLWAHQIKTPIAAMHILTQSLEETILLVGNGELEKESFVREQAAEESEKLFREMKMELFKTERYVEMVLSYLRAEGMGHDLLLKEYSLDSIIKQAVKKYSSLFISKQIHLDYRECRSQVLTDEKWLLFVLEQVLSNALKYTPRGGKIVIYQEGEGERRLVIQDNGIGISAEDLPRIFEKGFTGFNGRQDKKSTGIGLYLCKKVCDKLGHVLVVESKEGTGTCVYFYERGVLFTEPCAPPHGCRPAK